MNPELEARLRECGWSAHRQIPDEQLWLWLRECRAFGCHVFPEAVRVLREFGDLVWGNFAFDPLLALEALDLEEWMYWEFSWNEVLFPLGAALGESFVFALSSTGRVRGLGVSEIVLGDDFEEFLENRWLFQQGKIKWRTVVPEGNAIDDAKWDNFFRTVFV